MQEPGTDTLPGIFVPEFWPHPAMMADKYLLAAYLRPQCWEAVKMFAAARLHVDIAALPLSDQLYLLALGKGHVRVDAAKRWMRDDEEPVRALAALAQELGNMADGRHFDSNRMNNIISEMNRAKACLEGNRHCTRRRSRTPPIHV